MASPDWACLAGRTAQVLYDCEVHLRMQCLAHSLPSCHAGTLVDEDDGACTFSPTINDVSQRLLENSSTVPTGDARAH